MKERSHKVGHATRAQERLFRRKEYEAIRGRRSAVFWMLYAIVLVSLAAVAIGKAGLEHLRRRMDDPFTTWVNIPASNVSVGQNYPLLKAYLDSCAQRGAFRSRGTSGNFTKGYDLWSETDRKWNYARVQSFGFWKDSTLLRAILDADNLLHEMGGEGLAKAGSFQDGVIITGALLDDLGLTAERVLNKRLVLRNGYQFFPARVLAVVHTLPDKCAILAEHTLLRGMIEADDLHVLRPASSDQVDVLIDAGVEADPTEVQRIGLRLAQDLGVGDGSVIPEDGYGPYDHRVHLKLERAPSVRDLTGLQAAINKVPGMQAVAATILYETNYVALDKGRVFGEWDPAEEYRIFDNLSITFSALDSISAFQRDVARRFKLELDLDSIRSKENFNAVFDLSLFLIVALIVFASMAILLFLFNLVRNHLNSIKMNLGTFMAFGLSEQFLLIGYMRVIFKLLTRVLTLALLTLLLLQLAGRWLLARGAGLPDLFGQLDVITNVWLHLTVVALMGSAFIIFRCMLRRFLSATPGDLIYARK